MPDNKSFAEFCELIRFPYVPELVQFALSPELYEEYEEQFRWLVRHHRMGIYPKQVDAELYARLNRELTRALVPGRLGVFNEGAYQ